MDESSLHIPIVHMILENFNIVFMEKIIDKNNIIFETAKIEKDLFYSK